MGFQPTLKAASPHGVFRDDAVTPYSTQVAGAVDPTWSKWSAMRSPTIAPLRTSRKPPLGSPPKVDVSPTMPSRPSSVITPAASWLRVGSHVAAGACDVEGDAAAGLTHETRSAASNVSGRMYQLQPRALRGSNLSARIGTSAGEVPDART